MTDRISCPVCHWPSLGEASCGSCGWLLYGPHLLGPVTEELARRFAEDLDAAQHRLDARAARLATGGRDPAPAALTCQLRGGSAPRPDSQPPAPLGDLPPSAAVTDLLGRLVRADLASLTILQFGPDGLSRMMLRTDPVGTPGVVARASWTWAQLSGQPRVDPALLRFRLAGGIGRDPDVVAEALLDRIVNALPDLSPGTGGALLLLPPDPQWLVLFEVASRIARAHPSLVWGARAVRPDADAEVERLLRYAPIRHEYGLVLLRIDADGALRAVKIPLFPAGTSVNGLGPITTDVDVYLPRAATGPIAVPVVVGRDGDPRHWEPVAMARIALPVGLRTRLQVTLLAPGRLSFGGGLSVSEEDRPLAELLRLVPERPARPHLDLICAVDLSGPDPVAVARLELVEKFLDELAGHPAERGRVRVGLLLYGQHPPQASAFDPDESVRVVDFVDPARARAHIAACEPRPNRNDFAAAAEDMLYAVGQLTLRPEAQHVLLTVGARPPYPAWQQSDRAHPCTRRLDWRVLAADLRGRSMCMLGVAQHPDWHGVRPADTPLQTRWDDFWAKVGADGLFMLAETTAARLVEALGADSAPQLRTLPLAIAVSDGTTP